MIVPDLGDMYLLCKYFTTLCPTSIQFDFPLKHGIPLSKDLYQILREIEKDSIPNPFLWFFGQLMQITITPSIKQNHIVQNSKFLMNWPSGGQKDERRIIAG